MLFLEAGGVVVKFPLSEDEWIPFPFTLAYEIVCFHIFLPLLPSALKKEKKKAHFRIAGFHPENCK